MSNIKIILPNSGKSPVIRLSAMVVILLVSVSATVCAVSLPLINGGFEDPVAAEGEFVHVSPTGWTCSDEVGFDCGVANIGAPAFPFEAPEGNNVLSMSRTAQIEQTLSSTLTPGGYSLRMAIGYGVGEQLSPHSIQLFAGTTLLAQGSSTAPFPGEFNSFVLNYAVASDHPALGENLRVVVDLSGPADDLSFQLAADAVSLEFLEALPISYAGTLTAGAAQFGSVPSSGTSADPNAAQYWSFSGNQGDVVKIEALRGEIDLDPAFWVFEGLFTGSEAFTGGFDAAAFDSSDPGYIDFADDEIDTPGPFGDPRSVFTLTLPGTGQYTVAVTNFASGTNDGGDGQFDYQISLTNVPEPASVSLLGICLIGFVPRKLRVTAKP